MAFVWPHSHLAMKRLGIRPKTLSSQFLTDSRTLQDLTPAEGRAAVRDGVNGTIDRESLRDLHPDLTPAEVRASVEGWY
jgi:DNA-binding transcriptional regulator YdaS (Cro superfamily)